MFGRITVKLIFFRKLVEFSSKKKLKEAETKAANQNILLLMFLLPASAIDVPEVQSVLDLVFRYLSLFLLDINIKIGKNRC